jgi:MFS family permease
MPSPLRTRLRARLHASERSLVRNRDFVRLWTAESVSQLGSQVSLLALPLLAIKTLDASTFAVGAMRAVEIAPFLLVGLQAGVVVDRRARRPVLIVGDVGRAIVLMSIPVAWWLGVLTLAQLFVVVFLTGVLTVFFDVAYQSYLPALVDRDQLADGNSKLQMSESGAAIAGPGLAGTLVQLVGAPAAVVADAVSFVLSAASVLFIRRAEPPIDPTPTAERSTMRAEIGEGLRYVLGHPALRAIAGCTSTSNLFSSMLTAVLLVYVVRTLHWSAGLIGLFFMLGNVGFLTAAAFAGRVGRSVRLGTAIWVSILVGQIGFVIVAFAPRRYAFPWLVAGMVLFAAGGTIYNISQVSYRQAITPNRMLGRTNATMRFVVWGTMPIGSIAGGVLGTVFGLRATMMIAAIGGMLSVLWALAPPVRSLETLADPEPVEVA